MANHESARTTAMLFVILIGALIFVLLLDKQNALNFQLLGGIWILQTLPALVWLEQTARGVFVKHTLENKPPRHATLDLATPGTNLQPLFDTILERVPLTAREEITAKDPDRRLAVLAALTSNVSLNAARTIAASPGGPSRSAARAARRVRRACRCSRG